jgi:hypothetical protein
MKIKKFNESVEVEEIEKHLIKMYNQETTKEYVVKIFFPFNLSVFPGTITSDNNDLYVSAKYLVFEDVIRDYIQKSENFKENFYYIMEETKSRRIISREELEPYLAANKYNL